MQNKRERIVGSRGGSRIVRRGKAGQFEEVESVGRSMRQRGKAAKNEVKTDQGDKGDRKVSSKRGSSRGRTTSARMGGTRKAAARKAGVRAGARKGGSKRR